MMQETTLKQHLWYNPIKDKLSEVPLSPSVMFELIISDPREFAGMMKKYGVEDVELGKNEDGPYCTLSNKSDRMVYIGPI